MVSSPGCKKDISKGSEEKESPFFGLGIFLIALSFTVYLIYPVIPFLPFSARSKVITTLAVWGIGWVILSVGLMLSGKKGYGKFKQLSSRLWLRIKGWVINPDNVKR